MRRVSAEQDQRGEAPRRYAIENEDVGAVAAQVARAGTRSRARPDDRGGDAGRPQGRIGVEGAERRHRRCSRDFQRPAPAMIGMPIRNAKRAAASRFRPRNRPAAMVMPERLMPGNRASAWATPMRERVAPAQLAHLALCRRGPLRDKQQRRTDDAAAPARTAGWLAEDRVEEALAERAEQRGRDDADHQQPARRRSGSAPMRRSRIDASHATKSATGRARSR